MRNIKRYAAAATLAASCGIVSCHRARVAPAERPSEAARVVKTASRSTMVPFGSGDELAGFLRELGAARREDMRRRGRARHKASEGAAPSPSPSVAAQAGESITNTQHAGVDEGGIVKAHGDHLVVLRRGAFLP